MDHRCSWELRWPQSHIFMNTCPLLSRETCLDIFAMRYVDGHIFELEYANAEAKNKISHVRWWWKYWYYWTLWILVLCFRKRYAWISWQRGMYDAHVFELEYFNDEVKNIASHGKMMIKMRIYGFSCKMIESDFHYFPGPSSQPRSGNLASTHPHTPFRIMCEHHL